jgi:uncharacterized protein (TIGR02996 family)
MDTSLLAAFLADIKARPLDATPRLILADWIEENGESDADRARGELLRLSVKHPDATTVDAGPVGQQVRNGFHRHKADWLGPTAHLPGLIHTLHGGLLRLEVPVGGFLSRPMRQFTEGPGWLWVEGLTITGKDQRFPRVWQRLCLATISRLALHGAREFLRPHWPALFGSPYLGAVRDLCLTSGRLDSPETIAQLAAWPGLAHVDSLNLHGTRLSRDGVEALLASPHLGNLHRLVLTHCDLDEAGASAVFDCEGLGQVEELFLNGNKVTGAALTRLASAPMAPALRRLTLSSNSLGDSGMRALAVATLPSLRHLDVALVNSDVPGLTTLVDAPWLPHLESLNLSDNPLDRIIAPLLRAPLMELRGLFLSRSGLGEETGAALRQAKHLQHLQRLNLSHNSGLGHGIVAALKEANLPGLRHLDLSLTDFDDFSAIDLATWPGLGALETLDLGYNRMTDAGLRALIGSPHYRPGVGWSLRGNNISADLRRELSQRSPPSTLEGAHGQRRAAILPRRCEGPPGRRHAPADPGRLAPGQRNDRRRPGTWRVHPPPVPGCCERRCPRGSARPDHRAARGSPGRVARPPFRLCGRCFLVARLAQLRSRTGAGGGGDCLCRRGVVRLDRRLSPELLAEPRHETTGALDDATAGIPPGQAHHGTELRQGPPVGGASARTGELAGFCPDSGAGLR